MMTSTRHAAVVGIAGLGLVLLVAGGCHGGLHRRGEHRLRLAGSATFPITGDTLWPQGEGRSETAAVTVGYDYFVQDRWALTADLTPYRRYGQSDGVVTAGELQIGLRYYAWEFDLLDRPVGLYLEALGGLMYGSRSVPETGSHTNFTQDTGLGLEWQLTDHVTWMSGYRLRHLSNGRIFRSDSNPGQNDHLVYTGLAFSLN